MLDKLMFLTFVLNATGLFRFLAPQIGVSVGNISLVFLLINVLYLLAKAEYSIPLLLRGRINVWLLVLAVWPLLTVVYAPSVEIRDIGLLFYYISLFLCSIVFTQCNGLHATHRVMAVSLAVTIGGLVLSMLMPQYFETVATLVGARTEDTGRPIGFFMQPNVLAASLGFLFVGWFSLSQRQNPFRDVVTALVFLAVMLLTGSRTGMLVAVIVTGFIFTFSWRKQLLSARFILRGGLLAICLVGGVVCVHFYLANVGDRVARRKDDLIGRMETLLSFKLSSEGSLKDDTSIQGRIDAQEVYWSLVDQKPLTGHGFGSDTYYQEKGPIFLSAHSEALTLAMEYGIFYPLVIAFMMVLMYGSRHRRGVEEVFETNSIAQFIAISLLLFVVNGRLLDSRPFYVLLGMFFTALYYPQSVFHCDTNTGKICTKMAREAILMPASRGSSKRKAREPVHVERPETVLEDGRPG